MNPIPTLMPLSSDVIVALDVPGRSEAHALLKKFGEERPFIKVGMELFYAEGPDFVRELKTAGYRIFLDLKLHDIPHTVEQAMKRLTGLGVDMTNVHAGGGISMMKAAREGFGDGCLIAVTQLTSTSEAMMHEDLLIPGAMSDVVLHYASNAKAAGLNGVVCSPHESPIIHESLGASFLTVTPGIRFSGDAKNDQQRVTTPSDAGKLGSSFIVVGRSITAAEDPRAAYLRARSEFLEELK